MTEETGTATGQGDTATGDGQQDGAASGGSLLNSAGAEGSTSNGSADSQSGQTAPAAEIDYTDFKLADGITPDEVMMPKFKELAKGMKLTQEQAQSLVDLQTEIQKKQVEDFTRQSEQWAKDAQNDPDIGGWKFPDTLKQAAKGRDMFASNELRKLLEDTRLGNHPEVIRHFYNLGKAISEDRFIPNGKSSTSVKPPLEDRMYKSTSK